jgi:molybdate transport system ATP-binding protein
MIRFDAELPRGEFRFALSFEADTGALALFGPSGSGKSTALGVLSGLVRPQQGRVQVGNEILFDSATGIDVPPHRRRIGLVFQDALLLPHLTVRQNLLYGRWFARDRAQVVALDEVCDLLGISGLLGRRPAGLSGGERQRVAIGRALLSRPRLLLFDEPFASLDHARRMEVLPYILRLHERTGIPFVYVSHAIDEVARLADQVVVLEQGRRKAFGPPGEVLAPDWASAGEGRLAAVSVIDAVVREHDLRYGLTMLEHPAGPISVPGRIGEPGRGHRVIVRALDVGVAVQRPRDVSFRTVLRGTIRAIERDDSPLARVEIALRGQGRLVALVTRHSVDELALDAGDEIFAMVKAVALDDRALALTTRGRSAQGPVAGD